MFSMWTFQFVVSIIPISYSPAVASTSEPPALQCHQCHSQTNPLCLQIALNDTSFLQSCPQQAEGTQPFCRKIVQKIYARGGLEVVIRRCGWVRQAEGEGPCYHRRNHDYTGSVCDCSTDGCNSALSFPASSVIMAIMTLLAISCY